MVTWRGHGDVEGHTVTGSAASWGCEGGAVTWGRGDMEGGTVTWGFVDVGGGTR